MPVPITRSALVHLLSQPDLPTVVEALGAAFYADAHLPGAVNIPPGKVDVLAARLLPDMSAPVIVYGSGSTTSAVAVARRLEQLGYAWVGVYEGGKEDWVEHGLPVHRADAGTATP